MVISKVDTGRIPPDGGDKYNRLIFEQSPYLLQHADNPVDWYPWGDAAFALAKREKKPIFLSIGYSTCHWCHVMAHESFANKQVAAILNRDFIAIKVDREERPDIDSIYMKVAQLIGGNGGWPLTILMTPDRKPFFGGTYFPVESGHGRPGLIDILESTIELWQKDRDRLLGSAEKITGLLTEAVGERVTGAIDGAILVKGYQQLVGGYDDLYGGFGKAPKFPSPPQLFFLLRYWRRTGEKKALAMVKKTLTALRMGGIFDQLGGGVHRYSTDRKFLVPHFEKMLYDQALLAMAYLETYQATGEDFFGDTAREIFTYVLRDLTDPDGAFYSAEDADSEGVEGKFYLWSEAEIAAVLGKAAGAAFAEAFGVEEAGNYQDEVTGKKTGLNILHQLQPLKGEVFVGARRALFARRSERSHPFKDDKVLTSWNGLMIGALALGKNILGEAGYLAAAEKATDFVLKELRNGDGRLLRRYRAGNAALAAYLDDYAFFIFGLLNLYEASFKVRYLALAVELTGQMIDLFWDEEHDVFSFSGLGNEQLLTPIVEFYDGALPAGNSVAFLALLKLARLTDNRHYRDFAGKMATRIIAEAGEYPAGYTMFLSGLDFLLGPTGEIVIAGESGAPETIAAGKIIHKNFLPNKVVLLHSAGKNGKELERIAEYTRCQPLLGGKTTFYVCRDYSCVQPVTDLAELEELLEEFPADV